jgi:hypothetical protein
VIARVLTVDGVYEVDLDAEELTGHDPGETFEPAPRPELGLPRLVAAAAAGTTVVAVVEARPPLLVSHDAGVTWSESGRGLPAGFAVAVAADDPDVVVYAGRNRLYLSRDGGRFWGPLPLELPDVQALEIA